MKAITVIWTGTVFLLLLAAVSLVRVKRDYGKYDLLRPFTVFLVWALYILHFCLFLFTVFNHE